MLISPSDLKERLAASVAFDQARSHLSRVQSAALRTKGRYDWAVRKATRIEIVELCRRTFRELGPDHAMDMAASVAFYALLSLFPLIIAVIGLFSLVLEQADVERGVYWFFNAYLPGSDDLIRANVEVVGSIRGFQGVIGLLGLVWTSSMLAGAISRAVNRAWDIEDDPPIYIDKPRQIAMVIGLAPLLLMSIAATTALHLAGSINLPLVGRLTILENDTINLVTQVLPFAFSLVIFLMIYKHAPCTHTRWRYVWPGAVVAAVLFEIAKNIFALYLDTFADHERIYGSLASVIVMMGWVYVSGLILIIGAEFASEYERVREGVVRGHLVFGQSYFNRRRGRRRR